MRRKKNQLPFSLRRQITELLTSLPNLYDSDKQWAFVYSAGLEVELQQQIRVGMSQAQFVQVLVSTLSRHGKLEDGRHALEAILETAKHFVGKEGQTKCDSLIQELQALSQIGDFQKNEPFEWDYDTLPLDFSSKIRDWTQYFVGRQDAIARIDEFIQTHRSGYLAIVGEAGIGKSALLAHEVKKRNAVHHFVDDKQNSAKDEVFLRSVVGQLQQQYGFEFEERTPISVSEWNIYFHKWIKDISAEEQLLIFVDALDEAHHYGGSDNLLKYLPPELPEHIYFILSSRPEFKKEDITFFDSTIFERYDLLPFTQADIETYLAQRNISQQTSETATIIWEKSEGNPLYLYYLLQDFDGKNLTLEQISQLPQGLTKFYEKQWRERIYIGDKIAKEGRKQILCLPLLILKEPPSEELLLELTDFDRADLQEYLTPLHRFMRVGERYAIFHDSFKEFLPIKFHDTIESWHEKLIHHLLDWQLLENVPLKKYALSWLPLHLAEINDDERLFHLIETSTFLKVQEEFLSEKTAIAVVDITNRITKRSSKRRCYSYDKIFIIACATNCQYAARISGRCFTKRKHRTRMAIGRSTYN